MDDLQRTVTHACTLAYHPCNHAPLAGFPSILSILHPPSSLPRARTRTCTAHCIQILPGIPTAFCGSPLSRTFTVLVFIVFIAFSFHIHVHVHGACSCSSAFVSYPFASVGPPAPGPCSSWQAVDSHSSILSLSSFFFFPFSSLKWGLRTCLVARGRVRLCLWGVRVSVSMHTVHASFYTCTLVLLLHFAACTCIVPACFLSVL